MYFIIKLVIAIVLFFALDFLSVSISNMLGNGAYGIGDITTAISIQSTIIIFCTYSIIKAINKK
ncbi:MAG: hypothetical protein HFE58_11120 [Firmicutes bacterium]|jgi:hypothetical protein|nr:hypothetical protein [Bacillota bacterium]